MKSNRFSAWAGTVAAVLSATVAFCACEPFYEDLPVCPHGVSLRFVYDYNMAFGNALPNTVDELTLLIFDADSAYKGSRLLTKDELRDEDFRLQMEMPAGTYHFIAYGGLAADVPAFAFVRKPDSDMRMADVQTVLDTAVWASDTARRNLRDFYWGTLTLETADLYNGGTLHLMKNTHTVRVILQQTDGTGLSVDRYWFGIQDDHRRYDFQNQPICGDSVVYRPWFMRNTGVVSGDSASESRAEVGRLAIAEFRTGRLMASHTTRLLVRRADNGREVIDIPLTKYLEQMGSECHNLAAQEFLDREGDYTLFFFLTPDGYWLQTRIIVNDWEIRINEADF